jgi:hypothetical protein
MANETSTMESTPPAQSSEPSTQPDDKAQLKSLLGEARQTKEVLDGFIGAIRGGRFDGGAMMDLAKGLAFLDAIRNQNMAHIKNIQERLEKAA